MKFAPSRSVVMGPSYSFQWTSFRRGVSASSASTVLSMVESGVARESWPRDEAGAMAMISAIKAAVRTGFTGDSPLWLMTLVPVEVVLDLLRIAGLGQRKLEQHARLAGIELHR